MRYVEVNGIILVIKNFNVKIFLLLCYHELELEVVTGIVSDACFNF